MTRNATTCSVCLDDGWVELAGKDILPGPDGTKIEYDRGMTPCKWCDVGIALAKRLERPPEGRPYPIETDYGPEDIVTAHRDDAPLVPPPVWPPPIVETSEDAA